MTRIKFLLDVTRKIIAGQDADCPNCGSADTRLVERKQLVLQLRKCRVCGLLFRYPKDRAADNNSFYQKTYHEPAVTDLPAISDITGHIETNFSKIARDFSAAIALLRQTKGSGRLLDYGCSWGYGVHQFRAAGYDAAGFEISVPRAQFGRDHLGITIHGSTSELADQSFDVIFSSHVLEHIPDPKIPFRDFRRLLKPNGVLMILVPNGAGKSARELGVGWGPLIGRRHVLALTAEFFEQNLCAYGFDLLFGSSPYYTAAVQYSEAMPLSSKPDLDGEELLVIGRPRISAAEIAQSNFVERAVRLRASSLR